MKKLINNFIKNICIWYIHRYGLSIINKKYLYPWQRNITFKSNYNKNTFLPSNASEYLTRSNPKLIKLKQAYNEFISIENNLWKEGYIEDEHILYFRGDNPYVWQKRGRDLNIMSYTMTYFYLKNNDKDHILLKNNEDESFGIETFKINNQIISRDLLDSVNEIIFIKKHILINETKKINILDIGAGYGRLAHRVVETLTEVKKYYCTDAIAESTFISEYYIKYRKLQNKISVIPLHEVELLLEKLTIDLVINIHSFSEMDESFIKYWIKIISNKKIKYLFIIPNTKDKLISYNGSNFQSIIESLGYKLIIKKPKYNEPILQEYGLNPTYYYLFKYDN